MALADMRRREPAAARMLIEAKASGEPAEVRLALIELMRFGLNAEDAPFLKSLATDRSGKVQDLAGRLLARLGEHGHSSEGGAEDPAVELAVFIGEGKSGFIRRRTTYTPAKLKSRRRKSAAPNCSRPAIWSTSPDGSASRNPNSSEPGSSAPTTTLIS
ncbi:DUF5691 domain-containing protein [Mesorhizobium sp. M0909]|uniref:DUF5691 domain-containing protein n=1 Tax=Mesorhizobium sp. M0909 TaxID=2957024 RepID=UPI00333E0380